MVLHCRICASEELEPLVDFGPMPIGHHLRPSAAGSDARFPVRFHLCGCCGLLQIAEPIPAEILYSDADTYLTGFQKPAHLPDLVASMLAHRDPGATLEVGCNEGAFLRLLKERGFEELTGIEPNDRIAALGRAEGLDIRTGFFDAALAGELVAKRGHPFDCVVARQVLEHVEDVEGFLAGLRRCLVPGGLLVLELPQVEAGLDRGNPVILWEEHLNYFTEPMVERLLGGGGFRILERRHYAFGGGTIAFLAEADAAQVAGSLAAVDWRAGNPGRSPYESFAAGVESYRLALADLVAAYRKAGWKIALYGCSPRAATAINASRIGDRIDLAIDDRAEIQGRGMPGTPLAIGGFDALPTAGPILFLLGVGAENEYRVKRRIAARFGVPVRAVSLFPPRDCLASFAAAREALKS